MGLKLGYTPQMAMFNGEKWWSNVQFLGYPIIWFMTIFILSSINYMCYNDCYRYLWFAMVKTNIIIVSIIIIITYLIILMLLIILRIIMIGKKWKKQNNIMGTITIIMVRRIMAPSWLWWLSSLTIWFTMVIGQTQRNNMEVSENRGTPKSSIFVWDVPWNKPFFHHPAMGTPISGNLHIIMCLVVYLPLWKMMEFVSWGYDIPYWKVIIQSCCHVPNHQPDL